MGKRESCGLVKSSILQGFRRSEWMMHSATNENAELYPDLFVRLFWWAGALILLCIALSILHPGVDFVAALMGQLAIVPVWAVLTPRADAARCITGFFVCFAALVVGFQRLVRDQPEDAGGGEMLVATFFLVLLPIALRILGWASERVPDDTSRLQGLFQLSIRKILGLTTLAAVTIFVAQGEIAKQFFREGGALRLMVFLPGIAAWAILGFKSLRTVLVVLFISLLAMPATAEVSLWAPMLCYFAGVAVTLFVFRSLGFRLTKIPNRSRQPSSAEPSSLSRHDHP